ncbi:MAG TPA: hypothetical protein VGJ00_01615 [Rhabdochlamydiaceae bacterium]
MTYHLFDYLSLASFVVFNLIQIHFLVNKTIQLILVHLVNPLLNAVLLFS